MHPFDIFFLMFLDLKRLDLYLCYLICIPFIVPFNSFVPSGSRDRYGDRDMLRRDNDRGFGDRGGDRDRGFGGRDRYEDRGGENGGETIAQT